MLLSLPRHSSAFYGVLWYINLNPVETEELFFVWLCSLRQLLELAFSNMPDRRTLKMYSNLQIYADVQMLECWLRCGWWFSFMILPESRKFKSWFPTSIQKTLTLRIYTSATKDHWLALLLKSYFNSEDSFGQKKHAKQCTSLIW